MEPISRWTFDEDAAPDDIAVKDFEFGFTEGSLVVGAMLWLGFALFVTVALLLDLSCSSSEALAASPLLAAGWAALWVTLALTFNGLIYVQLGSSWALLFLAGYLLEELLSIDNLFVWLLIFQSFKTPIELQHKALLCGVLLSIFFRAIFICFGTLLLQNVRFALAIFGGFLLYSGVKAEWGGDDGSQEDAVGFKSFAVKLLGFVGLQVSEEDDLQGRLWVRQAGITMATPLLVVFLAVGVADVVFAVDSIPAILSITTERFIVLTSNAFAVLGLRSMYWVLASLNEHFSQLQHIMALMLSLAGAKLLLGYLGLHLEGSSQLFLAFGIAVMLAAIRYFRNRHLQLKHKELEIV